MDAVLTSIGEEFVVPPADLSATEIQAKAGGDGDADPLRIGFYSSISTEALCDTFARADRHPDVDINVGHKVVCEKQ